MKVLSEENDENGQKEGLHTKKYTHIQKETKREKFRLFKGLSEIYLSKIK